VRRVQEVNLCARGYRRIRAGEVKDGSGREVARGCMMVLEVAGGYIRVRDGAEWCIWLPNIFSLPAGPPLVVMLLSCSRTVYCHHHSRCLCSWGWCHHTGDMTSHDALDPG
jgi:hypothetical protein